MKSIRHEEHRYTRKDTKKYVYEAEFVTEDKYCRVLLAEGPPSERETL